MTEMTRTYFEFSIHDDSIEELDEQANKKIEYRFELIRAQGYEVFRRDLTRSDLHVGVRARSPFDFDKLSARDVTLSVDVPKWAATYKQELLVRRPRPEVAVDEKSDDTFNDYLTRHGL